MRRLGYIAMTCVVGVALAAGCSDDKTADTGGDGGGGGGVTVPDATGAQVTVIAGDKSDTEQFLTVEPASVKAGPVTFTFQNTGTRAHEMVVLKTDIPFDQLEVTNNRVSEDASVGEIGETEAGKTVTKTFELEPGKYVLACNVEKHYEQGMTAAFTVTP